MLVTLGFCIFLITNEEVVKFDVLRRLNADNVSYPETIQAWVEVKLKQENSLGNVILILIPLVT